MKNLNELDEYLYSNEKYKSLLEDIQNLNCIAEKTTSTLSDMPHANGVSDKVGDYASLLTDTKKKLSEQVITILNQGTIIREKILKINNPHQQVLYYKYILNNSLTDIADTMNYSYTHIKKLHKDALKLYLSL